MISLSDPPRLDSLFLITVFHVLGVAMVMSRVMLKRLRQALLEVLEMIERLNVAGYEQARIQIDSTTAAMQSGYAGD